MGCARQAQKADEEGSASPEPRRATDVAPRAKQPFPSRRAMWRSQPINAVASRVPTHGAEYPNSQASVGCQNESVGTYASYTCTRHFKAVMHSRQGVYENITKCSVHSKLSWLQETRFLISEL